MENQPASALSTTIHPTAVVDPSAKFGEGCEVGPYCVVGPDVELGPGCRLIDHVSITGPTKAGARNVFYPFAAIGQRTQDLKYAGEPTRLEIGDDNSFREFCTIHRSTSKEIPTRIGCHNHFLAYSHIAHDCEIGDHVIFSNNGTAGGHVTVGDHAIISGLSAIHQFCRIGEHAITGGCTKIVQDVAPFMIVDGNPGRTRGINLVGLERRGFTAEDIKELKRAYKILFRSDLNTAQALEALHGEFTSGGNVGRLIAFVEKSERGITR